MLILDGIEQRSEEWYKIKAGIPSASNFDKIITAKGTQSKSYKKYIYRLAAEAVTGRTKDFYVSKSMQDGIDNEPKARELYSFVMRVDLTTPGFVFNDETRMYGCSPDALVVGQNWGLEVKCPDQDTQAEYLIEQKLPSIYFHQVQGSMLVTGFERWDFISYCEGLAPLIIKVKRDEVFIGHLQKALEKFCIELAGTIKTLRELGQ